MFTCFRKPEFAAAIFTGERSNLFLCFLLQEKESLQSEVSKIWFKTGVRFTAKRSFDLSNALILHTQRQRSCCQEASIPFHYGRYHKLHFPTKIMLYVLIMLLDGLINTYNYFLNQNYTSHKFSQPHLGFKYHLQHYLELRFHFLRSSIYK